MAAAYAYTLAGVCEKVIRQTSALAGKNYAMTLEPATGALDFILSPANGGIKASYTQEGTKVIRAKVLYKQRSLPCEIQDGADAIDASVCDTAVEPVEKSADLTVADALASAPKKFTNENLVQICQETQSWINEFLLSDLSAMRQKLDQKILAKIAAGSGVLLRQDGTTKASGYQSVDILKTNSGIKIPLTGNYNDVLMDYSNMQFSGLPALIGQGNLQTALSLMGMACCNSNTPYADALSKAGAAFYLDQQANQVLGAASAGASYTRALMTAYGASHLLWFNPNKNVMIDTEILKSITIQDPKYPALMWDLDFKFDVCTKTWTYAYSARFDVYNTFKSDAFKSNDPSPGCDDALAGVTGIWKYEFGIVA